MARVVRFGFRECVLSVFKGDTGTGDISIEEVKIDWWILLVILEKRKEGGKQPLLRL